MTPAPHADGDAAGYPAADSLGAEDQRRLLAAIGFVELALGSTGQGGFSDRQLFDAVPPRKQTAGTRHRDAFGRERISERIRPASVGVAGV